MSVSQPAYNTTSVPTSTYVQPLEPAPGAVAVARSRTLLMFTMGVALIVLLVIVILQAGHPRPPITSAEQAATPAAPPVTSATTAPAPAAPPVVAAPSTTVPAAPPLTSAQGAQNGTLPADVDAYLKFMAGIEQRRIALNNDTDSATDMLSIAHQMQSQGGDGMGSDTDGSTIEGQNVGSDPTDLPTGNGSSVAKISKGFGDYTSKWQKLIRDFEAVPPPGPCQTLAAQYDKFLTEYAAAISKLQVALLNNDIGGAMAMQGAQGTIDTDGTEADADLTDLCNRYNAPKPFTIAPEGSSPSLLTQ